MTHLQLFGKYRRPQIQGPSFVFISLRTIFVLVLFLFSQRVFSQVFSGPASRATGGAGRAIIDASEAALVNPATLTQARGLSGAFHKGSRWFNGGPRSEAALVFVDNSESVFLPASVAIVVVDTPQVELYDIQITGAHKLTGKLSGGFTYHHSRLSERHNSAKSSVDNVHLGLLYTPYLNLGFAVVIYDVFPGETESIMNEFFPRQRWALGAQYNYSEGIRTRMDLASAPKEGQDSPLDVMWGLETQVVENMIVRMGHEWRNSEHHHFFTVGIGWVGPRLSADLALQFESEGRQEPSQVVDLRIPL